MTGQTNPPPDFADTVNLVLNWQTATKDDPSADVMFDANHADRIFGNLVSLSWTLALTMAQGDEDRAIEILMAFGRAFIDTEPPDGADRS